MTQLAISFERSKTVEAVRKILMGRWLAPHTVHQMLLDIGHDTIAAEAMTARIRDLRKPQYGGFTVPKRWNGRCYEYTLGEPKEAH